MNHLSQTRCYLSIYRSERLYYLVSVLSVIHEPYLTPSMMTQYITLHHRDLLVHIQLFIVGMAEH